jgi:OTU domain-containing protein 3
MLFAATYGGHLELSAFAHMAQRDVKVIQPGLVYVIEWNNASNEPQAESPDPDDPMLDEREKRRVRRDKKRAEKEKDILGEGSGSSVDSAGSQVGTIYVA